ncbi:hypothetical protein VULLAG_LOCUS522 [Vulpes lagopus]
MNWEVHYCTENDLSKTLWLQYEDCGCVRAYRTKDFHQLKCQLQTPPWEKMLQTDLLEVTRDDASKMMAFCMEDFRGCDPNQVAGRTDHHPG